MIKHCKTPSMLETTRNSIDKNSAINELSTIKRPFNSPFNLKKIRSPSTIVQPLQQS
jgi:hypothetical protein